MPPAPPPGSEADPTGFHLDTAHHAWQNDTCSTGLVTLSCGDSHAQSSGQGPGVGVRDVFSRGMAGVQAWPPGLDHRRPFFDEHPRQGGIYNFQFQYPRCGAVCPGMFEALEKRHTGELDPFEVDGYIHHYHKQSQELYVYINSQSHSNASLPLWLAAIDADEQGISVWQPATKLPHEEKQNNA